MVTSYFDITLDINSSQSQFSLTLKQGDNARGVCISLVDGGKPYIIEEKCFSFVNGENTEGKEVSFSGLVQNNKIYVDLCINSSGIYECEATLFDARKNIITSPRFTIYVDNTVADSKSYETSNEYLSLKDYLIEVKANEEARQEAEENRKEEFETNEANRQNTFEANEEARQELVSEVADARILSYNESFENLGDAMRHSYQSNKKLIADISGFTVPCYEEVSEGKRIGVVVDDANVPVAEFKEHSSFNVYYFDVKELTGLTIDCLTNIHGGIANQISVGYVLFDTENNFIYGENAKESMIISSNRGFTIDIPENASQLYVSCSNTGSEAPKIRPSTTVKDLIQGMDNLRTELQGELDEISALVGGAE